MRVSVSLRISDNEDIGLAEASYAAALQVTSQGFGLSLMDFWR